MNLHFGLAARIAVIAATAATLAVIGCSSDTATPQKSCAPGETLCGDNCAETAADPANCGACGNACKPGEVCSQGNCALTCAGGSTQCGQSCFDLDVDPKNCGACGQPCAAGEVCTAGKCAAQCPAAQTLCVGDGGAVACINPDNDSANCGACGNVCDPGKVCTGGQCKDTCGAGKTLCPTDGGAPACAATDTDGANCGQCGNVCTSGLVCSGGQCVANCGPTEVLCSGGDAGAPYCARTDTDNANCGQCGNACGQGLICSGGQCVSQCSPGYTRCGNACVDIQGDRDNCGQCGKLCTGSTPYCLGGVCSSASGTVTDVNGIVSPVVYAKCGNGTNTNCTESVAQTSCTAIGKKLVSHASDGTSAVVSLGATTSCYWSISYYTNTDNAVAGQCLIGVSNAYWTNCCGLSQWHGNIVTVPATLGQQFGYVYTSDSGYNGGKSNVSGTTWGCIALASTPPARAGCTTYYVACE